MTSFEQVLNRLIEAEDERKRIEAQLRMDAGIVPVFRRYEFHSTPAHGYLRVPWEDLHAVLGPVESFDDETRGILAYCPTDDSHIWIEEDDSMYLFLTRAKEIGWDIDKVKIESQVWMDRNDRGNGYEWLL